MPYSPSDIIQWAKMSQAYAAIGEAKKRAVAGNAIDGYSVDTDLHIKLYVERSSLVWALADDPDADNIYPISNWVYALCFPYVLQAQLATGGGGDIAPISPTPPRPDPYYFIVSDTSFMVTGASEKEIPLFTGYNIVFVRNGIPQSTVNTEPSYFSWNPATGIFSCSPALIVGELIAIVPV